MVGRFVSNVSTQNWWRSQGIMIFWGTNTRVFVPPPLCSTVQRRCNGGTDVCGHLFGWVMMHLGQGMQGSHSGFNHIQKLVGGFNHLEKYEVNGKDYPIYYGKNVWNHQPVIGMVWKQCPMSFQTIYDDLLNLKWWCSISCVKLPERSTFECANRLLRPQLFFW